MDKTNQRLPVMVRLTRDEKQAFRAAADRHGLTLAGWVRLTLRLALIRAGRAPETWGRPEAAKE